MDGRTVIGKMPFWSDSRLWNAFMALTIFCILVGSWLEDPFLMLVPGILLGAAWFLADLRQVFYLLLFFIPLSIEMNFSNGLGTDLPTEPLIILMTGAFVLLALHQPNKIRFTHIFDLLLLIHLAWIACSAIFAEIPLIALKFLLAKTWYILTFYGMGRLFLTSPKSWRIAIWCLLIPLAVTHIIILVRFSAYGFSFKDVNSVVGPFNRNHVTFAALAVVFLPFGWNLFRSYRHTKILQWVILALLLIILVGVQVSYTRAAYLALLGGIGSVFLIRYRLIIPTLVIAVVAIVLFGYSLVQKNRFLEFAPDYNKTISHFEFEDLLTATVKLQDISTMERVYRWVAGSYMIGERPWTGFGPNNFYQNYEVRTVRSFQTYVSDNPEKSGIHNYYLMTAVEQGIPGLIIYLILIFTVLILGERIYHRTNDDQGKRMVLTVLASLVVIHVMQTMNDLLETDKVGPFFFMSIAILANIDRISQKETSTGRTPTDPVSTQSGES
ncbi:MAG: O-antigen ligase family protein [Saprospiraceae bacterium]|nr:O-antigen ligase family protein [Saprospiraceae bacterium]